MRCRAGDVTEARTGAGGRDPGSERLRARVGEPPRVLVDDADAHGHRGVAVISADVRADVDGQQDTVEALATALGPDRGLIWVR